MASNVVQIRIDGFPEALFAMRTEMARFLRAEAETESDPRFARRLGELADVFEAGGRGDTDGGGQ